VSTGPAGRAARHYAGAVQQGGCHDAKTRTLLDMLQPEGVMESSRALGRIAFGLA
jgi:hypothetical protein